MKSAVAKSLLGLVCAALFGAMLFTASISPAGADHGEHGFTTHSFNPPSSTDSFFTAGQAKTFNVSTWFTPNEGYLGLRLTCPVIPPPNRLSKFSEIAKRNWLSCEYTFTAKPSSTSGNEAITLIAVSTYVNPAGLKVWQSTSVSATFTFGPVSSISFSASLVSDFHYVRSGLSINIDASVYASDGTYTVSCGEATNINNKLSSVIRPDAANNPCSYTVTAARNSRFGDFGRFTVPYTSTGGDTRNAIITVLITAPNSTEQPFTQGAKPEGTPSSDPSPAS